MHAQKGLIQPIFVLIICPGYVNEYFAPDGSQLKTINYYQPN